MRWSAFWSLWARYTLLLGALVCVCCKPAQPPPVSLDNFDTRALLELKTFGDWDLAQELQNRYSVILYFSELSCGTCSDIALKKVSELYQDHKDQVDFMLVVHGQDPTYLANLRRVGKVRWPILLEEFPGQSGFHTELTTIVLLDKQTQSVVTLIQPQPDSQDPSYARFQESLIQELASQNQTTAHAQSQRHGLNLHQRF